MRGALLLAALVALAPGAARAAAPLKEPGHKSDQQVGWAIYAGPSPFSPGDGTFLTGDSWTPQVFSKVPADLQIGTQGRLTSRLEEGQTVRQVEEFDPTEVPVRTDYLAEGEGEPAILKGRSRTGGAMLLRALAPGDPRVLWLLKRWYKQKELTPGEWAFALRAGGFDKALQVAAKSEPEAAYQLLGAHFQARRFAQAKALLKSRGRALEPLLAARHDSSEPECAPVAAARPGAAPTGLSFVRLLDLAATFAQGKRKPALKGLKGLQRKIPRLQESLCLGAADRQPDHELFQPERPRALLRAVPGFAELLAR